jgi:transposase-like protein
MNSHKNAPLTPKGREAMVRNVTEGGLSQAAAARQFNITPKIVAKWVNRFHAEGVEGLRDRSSRPHSLPICASLSVMSDNRIVFFVFAVAHRGDGGF